MKCLHLFANTEQHLQSLKPLPQFKEQRQPLLGGVGPDDQFNDLTAFVPQFTAQRVFVVAAEVPDDFLKINRNIKRFLVYRQMLVAGHLVHLPAEKTEACRGAFPPAPPIKRIKSFKSPNHQASLAASDTPYIVAVDLAVVAHGANVEDHVPREVRIVGVGSRRPVVDRLHINKRIVLRPTS